MLAVTPKQQCREFNNPKRRSRDAPFGDLMKRYRIYYGDGTIFNGLPWDAPAHNIQAIAWNDPTKGAEDVGRIVLYEWDIYIYSDHVGDWHGTNKYADLLQHLGRGCGPGGVRAVLQGAWIERTKFQEIINRARNDPGLDRKSANNSIREDGSE